jgi:hypothetical protein
MKRAILAAVLGVAGSMATSYGQGLIQFNNYNSFVYNPVVWGAGSGGTVGNNVNSSTVEVALYYVLGNVSGDTTSAFLTAAGSPVATTYIITGGSAPNAAGTYGTGPDGFYQDASPVTLAGWSNGQTATFMVEAWQAGTGGTQFTYSQAAVSGVSALWTEVGDTGIGGTLTGFGIVPSSDPAGNFLSGPPTTTISAVPEPTTLALAGLGGAALMALRRKKA